MILPSWTSFFCPALLRSGYRDQPCDRRPGEHRLPDGYSFTAILIAHINVNWLSPVKVRRTLIGGSKQMIVYDDMEASEKVKVYDKGITVTE